MYSRRSALILFIIVLASFAIAVFYYPRMPEYMASNFDARGNVNGYTPRFWGTFFTPILLGILFLIFSSLSALIRSRQVAMPASSFVGPFLISLFTFFALINLQVIEWNAGHKISFAITIPIGVGAFFMMVGQLLGSLQPNWFVGIRTYWTLKNKFVWEKTHERAAILFRILGVIYMSAVFFREYILFFMLLPAIFLSLYLLAYSFLLYQQVEKFAQRTNTSKKSDPPDST